MKPLNKTIPNGNGAVHLPDDDTEINIDDFDWSHPLPHPTPNFHSEGFTTKITAGDTILIIPTYTPERLKQLRTALNMTAQQFGIAVGYASSGAKVRISELEHGRQAIPQAVSIIAAYIEQYGVLAKSRQIQHNETLDL